MRFLKLFLAVFLATSVISPTVASARSTRYVPFLGREVRIEALQERAFVTDASFKDYGAPAARKDFGLTGTGIEICVVDTGVDATHEQLDNGKVVAFKDFVGTRTNPYDDYGHGTHVASIIAGDGRGPSGLAAKYKGVAPKASISAAKVLSNTGSGSVEQVIAGIEWCSNRPSVRVINMSLSTMGHNEPVDDAVAVAVSMGKVVVVSAGNMGPGPGSMGSPSDASTAITVGAASGWSKRLDNATYPQGGPYLAAWSSRGGGDWSMGKPDVVAPGIRIMAAGVARFASPTGYTALSGTSMSSPFVTGIAALMLQAKPSLAPSAVKVILRSNTLDLGQTGPDPSWGAGLLNGYSAAASATGKPGKDIFPPHEHLTGTIGDGVTWFHTFWITDFSQPISATILLDPTYTDAWHPFADWQMNASLRNDETDQQMDSSFCGFAGDDPCGYGSGGQQETLSVFPYPSQGTTEAGKYTIILFPDTIGTPYETRGGSFAIDLFYR